MTREVIVERHCYRRAWCARCRSGMVMIAQDVIEADEVDGVAKGLELRPEDLGGNRRNDGGSCRVSRTHSMIDQYQAVSPQPR